MPRVVKHLPQQRLDSICQGMPWTILLGMLDPGLWRQTCPLPAVLLPAPLPAGRGNLSAGPRWQPSALLLPGSCCGPGLQKLFGWAVTPFPFDLLFPGWTPSSCQPTFSLHPPGKPPRPPSPTSASPFQPPPPALKRIPGPFTYRRRGRETLTLNRPLCRRGAHCGGDGFSWGMWKESVGFLGVCPPHTHFNDFG